MPYREVIKNFELVRSVIRDFYVYGFNRDSSDIRITGKSKRSNSDERHRIESWLGDYLGSHKDDIGKSYFLSIDSRADEHNPFFRAWKTSSFTDKDINMHFLLMDILYSPEVELPYNDIVDRIFEHMECDESSIRKKLKEYVDEGLVNKRIKGKTSFYSRAQVSVEDLKTAIGEERFMDFLDFYSEISHLGVVGSYISDKLPGTNQYAFAFKHHYITQTVDSDILLQLFECVHDKKTAIIQKYRRKLGDYIQSEVVPLKLYCSSVTGRQYMMCFNPSYNCYEPVRIDYVMSVSGGEIYSEYDEIKNVLLSMENNMWGISVGDMKNTSHVSFTVEYSDYEPFILARLQREKRCGTVTVIDNNHARFDADVYYPMEMIPWIRTFICRITHIDFEDKELQNKFIEDLRKMEEMYG